MPLTTREHDKRLHSPALCEQLPVRDYLDNVVVRTNGALVAGYELRGLMTYFASDEGRNRGKLMLEALLRSIPEQSMKLQLRYETVEDVGNLIERYQAIQESSSPVAASLDEVRIDRWLRREQEGHYSRPLLHAYFIWNPKVHHRVTGKATVKNGEKFSLSARKMIQRSREHHAELLAEFESVMSGIEATMHAAELGARRLTDNELFLEAKRALNPFAHDSRPYRRGEEQLAYRSARN